MGCSCNIIYYNIQLNLKKIKKNEEGCYYGGQGQQGCQLEAVET